MKNANFPFLAVEFPSSIPTFTIRQLSPLLFWLLTIAGATAQTVANHHIIIGKTDSLYSRILHEKREVWVYLPPGYDDPLFISKRFPVAYLLDGDAYYPSVTSIMHKLSETGIMNCPEMIVVAILNTDRTRDMTPSHSLVNGLGKQQPEFGSSGGGDNFAAFLARELLPHIDSLYPTAPYKVLMGHSLGGLAVMNMALNHTALFNAYVAMDPSMWWDNQWLLKRAPQVLKQRKFAGRSLYLAIANTMGDDLDTLRVRKDTSIATRHIRSLLDLKDVLQRNAGNGLQWAYRYYGEESHETVPLLAEYDALRFLFSYYKMSNDDQAKINRSDNADIVALLDAHYAKISSHMGYQVLPVEGEINWLGWYFLQMNWPQKAYQMFALNLRRHPQSASAYDSLGDYYSHQKENAKAIECYNQALKLNDSQWIRKKRDELQAKNR